jgi:hypothetical protein
MNSYLESYSLAQAGQEGPYATAMYTTSGLNFNLFFINSLITLNLTETQFAFT